MAIRAAYIVFTGCYQETVTNPATINQKFRNAEREFSLAAFRIFQGQERKSPYVCLHVKMRAAVADDGAAERGRRGAARTNDEQNRVTLINHNYEPFKSTTMVALSTFA